MNDPQQDQQTPFIITAHNKTQYQMQQMIDTTHQSSNFSTTSSDYHSLHHRDSLQDEDDEVIIYHPHTSKTCFDKLSKLKGFLIMIIVVVFVDLSRIFMKQVYNSSALITPIAFIFQRTTAMLVVIFLLLVIVPQHRKSFANLNCKATMFIALRSVFAAINAFCMMFSGKLLLYSTLVLISFLAPLVVPFSARIFLSEPLKLVDIFSLVISFVGLFLYSNASLFEDFNDDQKSIENPVLVNHLWGYFSSFTGFICFAIDLTLLRKIRTMQITSSKGVKVAIHYFPTIFGFVIVLFIGSLLVLPIQYIFGNGSEGFVKDLKGIGLIFTSGALNLIGMMLLVVASKYDKAAKLAIVWFFEVIFALIMEVVLFNGKIKLGQILGASIILLTNIIVTIMKLYSKE